MTQTIGKQVIKGLGLPESEFEHLKGLIEFDKRKIKTLQPEAKRLIKNFRRKMATLLTQGLKTDVYNLNVQLVPVTKVNK